MKTSIAATTIMVCSAINTGHANSLHPLLEELAMLTGKDAKKCGPVLLGENAEMAWSCVMEAEKDNSPYWIAIQYQGIDSDVWTAGLRTPAGKRYVLEYDSNYRGSPGLLLHFSRKECRGRFILTMEKDIICGRSDTATSDF